MAVFAYLRVSTRDQTTEQQLSQIAQTGYQVERDRIYVEHGVSGKVPAMDREEFAKLSERLQSGDSVVVSKLDRLGRDILDVIQTVRSFADRNVVLDVLGLGKLDGSPQATLTLNMLAAISQFERELISERTKAKLQELKASGKKLGRPSKINDKVLAEKARFLMSQGSSWRVTAKQLGIALSTLQRLLKSD
jgi:putative DNA-invertase from lambdoid prophage Rac